MKVKSLSRIRLFVTPWIVAHGIFQARVLAWVAISPGALPAISPMWDQTWVSCIAGRGFTSEPPGKPYTLEEFPTNVRLAKAMVFPVVMYGCENWTIKKAEHQTNDAFEL